MTRHEKALAVLTGAVTALALAPPAAAQDAAEILNRTAEAYRQIRTWDIEQTVVVETAGIPPSRTERRERYAAVEGKHRWEQDTRMSIADGRYEWTYSSRTNQYTRSEQGPVGGGPLPMGYWTPDAERVVRARLAGEENIVVDGVAVPCYVVEIERGPAPGSAPGSPPEPPETLWIDKVRYLVLERQRRTSPVFAPQRIRTTTLTRIQVNEPLPDSVFTFLPPDGSALETPASITPPDAAEPATPARKKKGQR